MIPRRQWLCGACALLLGACSSDSNQTRLATFSTSLAGRSRAQRHNAAWAIQRLNHAFIRPSAVFSFNLQVGPWTRDQGVLRAPVSYGGILVPSWGGGVCQVSTTFYCVALLSGLEILERHPHEVAPAYIPAGMDAAVAFDLADLRVRNPFAFPVQVHCQIEQDRVTCQLIAMTDMTETMPMHYELARELVTQQPPPLIDAGKIQQGRSGVRVRLWRIYGTPGKLVRELCHETEYAPLPHSF
jgi:vancomycin resistance protein VanW